MTRIASLAPMAFVLAACATDTIVSDAPRAATELAIAPYEFHEECAELQAGDRYDYRFESKAPVSFEIYYRDGIAYIATVSREDTTEFSGVFSAPAARRYCLRWEAGREGALVDFRIRLLRAGGQ
ncbi:MAG TPA: hypothetical protein VMN56_02415 [Casimicrobiaceae bacterium]|nr:hypothetical protein [Casimicrobiaceae bacterium]